MRHSKLWAAPFWLEFETIRHALTRSYYIFVEDASPVANPKSLEAPDASTVSPPHPVFGKKPFRFRTSGVRTQDFLEREEAFDVLVPGRITREQRERRLGQLRELFEAVAVPIIDVYASEEDEEFRAMRATLLPGTWHVAAIGYEEEAAGSYPVFSTRGEGRVEAGYEGGGLLALAPVYPPVEERLRDIFSLNHVGDSDVAPDDGSDRAPMDPGNPAPQPAGVVETETECAYQYQSQRDEEEATARRREQERQYEARRAAEKRYLTQSH